jgi:hypothetical protein
MSILPPELLLYNYSNNNNNNNNNNSNNNHHQHYSILNVLAYCKTSQLPRLPNLFCQQFLVLRIQYNVREFMIDYVCHVVFTQLPSVLTDIKREGNEGVKREEKRREKGVKYGDVKEMIPR